MNNLKMYLALIALMIPLLLCAKGKRIDLKKERCNHRTPAELFIPVEAFINERNKELTIEFLEDCDFVTIEVRDNHEMVTYRTYHNPQEERILTIPLDEINEGVYLLLISNPTLNIIGEFTIK